MRKKSYIRIAVIGGAVVFAGLLLLHLSKKEIRHVILISIDTCRADYLSCYGYPRETTPHIDAVAEHATRFEHVVSPVPITLPAHSTMMTGTIPPFHRVHNNIGYQLAPSNVTLAEVLKEEGYRTAAFISTFVLDGKLGLSQGFDIYHDKFESVHTNKFGNERKGDETTRYAVQWLEDNKDEKSFLFLHYYDPHEEYEPPEPYASEFADNLYAGEIAFTDHCIGQVIRKLKELGIYDSSLLIITSDHGEMLGEHGEEEHTYFIYESAIRVPLIIKLPGQKKGRVVGQLTGIVDLMPTLTSLLDIELPAEVQGRDISPFLFGKQIEDYERGIYSESITPTRIGASALTALSTGRWKYIQAPRPELYNIAEDPGELQNLFAQEGHRARILADRLQQKIEQSITADIGSHIELDAESLRRLQSLGYVAGSESVEWESDDDKADPKDLILFFVSFQEALTSFADRDYDQTRSILLELIPTRPDFHELYMYLGDIEMLQSNFEKAVKYYRSVLELKPSQQQALNNLAWLQATRPSLETRDVDEALRHAIELNKLLQYRDPNALDTLAVCYAADGQYAKAADIAQKAVRLAEQAGDTTLVAKLVYRRALFEQSQPYVEE